MVESGRPPRQTHNFKSRKLITHSSERSDSPPEMEVPVPYVVQYVVYHLDDGFIDVESTKENLRIARYFVSDYDKDDDEVNDFSILVLNAIENRWNRDEFVEHLQEYNYLHESDALDNDYDLKDAQDFDADYGEEFCAMHPQITMDMLLLEGGSDWNNLPAYKRFGMEFMEMVKNFMAQIDRIRSAAARARREQAAHEARFQADDTRCVRRKIA